MKSIPWSLMALLLLITRKAVAAAIGNSNSNSYNVPLFTLDELRNTKNHARLSTILATTGLLSIAVGDEQLLDTPTALEGLCHCPLLHQHNDALRNNDQFGMDSAVMSDGRTVRHTLATATVGNRPLPLPFELEQVCGVDTLKQLENLRDVVAMASSAFVQALDELLLVVGGGSSSSSCGSTTITNSLPQMPLLKDIYGKTYTTLSSIITSANHLEHFHLYDQNKSTSSIINKNGGDGSVVVDKDDDSPNTTLDWHTDAGLFLAFVPGHVCGRQHLEDADDSFWFQTEKGETIQATFAPNSVVLMLGGGAQHWLKTTTLKFRATHHALRMKREITQRVWYGMMHLVPESAIIQYNPPRTLKQLQQSMVLTKDRKFGRANSQQEDHASIGCGDGPASTSINDDDSPSSIMEALPRHRLQVMTDASDCNNVTNFFCWMSCLDVPDADRASAYVREGYSLYCVDPSILDAGKSIQNAMDPCLGEVHNYNCLGRWELTAPGVIPSANFSFDWTPTGDTPFCYGGTSMYMDGFHWVHSTTCVIYLFPEWILSSRLKLAVASVGTIVFGALLEFAIFQRRRVMTNMQQGGHQRLGASALFYGAQLSMGYMLMLVVMTYSGVLFFCTILGIVSGHVLFNAKDALLFRDQSDFKKSPGVASDMNDDAEPMHCCAGTQETGKEDVGGVPEGSTPCCQHTL